MTPPAKRIRFSQTPVRRSSRVHCRPDRYEVEGSPRRSRSRTANVHQASVLADVRICESDANRISTDLQSLTPEKRPSPSECRATSSLEATREFQSEKRQCSLLDLPPDILRIIFNMFSFQAKALHTVSRTLATGSGTFLAQQVSRSLRPVCRHLHREAGNFLNSALLALSSRLTKSLRALEMQLTCAEDEVEWRIASRAYSALETVYSQYRLVEAVIWRWLSPRYLWDVTGRDAAAASVAATSAGCCYAGRFLDDLYRLATTAVTTPGNLVLAALSQQAQIDAAVTRFINYFEKTAGGAAWRRSAQMVDILDCLLAARYTATQEANESEAAAGICKLRGRYALPRAWFTSLPLGEPPMTDTTADEARLMLLRLRRLVRSSNKHHLESIQREREGSAGTSFSTTPLAAYLSSPASTYSGFGESANRFFYYGSMNERAAKAREATEDTQAPAQQPNIGALVQLGLDPDYEPPQPAVQRNDLDADNHSESSGEDDLPPGNNDIDDNEIALLEADAQRDMDDVLAEMNLAALHPPHLYNDVDAPLPPEEEVFPPEEEVFPPEEEVFPPDVDDYQWLDEANLLQFEVDQAEADDVAALDEEMNAEEEPVSGSSPPSPQSSINPSSLPKHDAEQGTSSEKCSVEDQLLDGNDLLFDVDLTCPIELAPLAVCRKFEFATLEYEARKLAQKTSKLQNLETKYKAPATSRSKKDRKEVDIVEDDFEINEPYGFHVPFHLTLTIRCPTSARNRLPPIYVYEVRSPTP